MRPSAPSRCSWRSSLKGVGLRFQARVQVCSCRRSSRRTPEVARPFGHVRAHVLLGIALVGAAIGARRPEAGDGRGFGGDEDLLLFAGACSLGEDLRDELLAPAVAVAGGGVDEVAAQVQCAVQRGDGIGVGLLAPGAADGPGAEADLGAVEIVAAEGTEFHGSDVEAKNQAGRVLRTSRAGPRGDRIIRSDPMEAFSPEVVACAPPCLPPKKARCRSYSAWMLLAVNLRTQDFP